MAASGYTPILLYASGTASNVPLAANMTSSASGAELALNYADGKLYYKNSSGAVTLLASATTVTNSFSAGTTGFTPNTATTGAVTLAGTLNVANGGTGQTTLATGALGYGQGTSAHASLAIGTAGQVLTVNSGATAPQWSTLSGVAVTTFSAGTTGFTPNSATSGAITLAGTLATTNGGTGLTSFTANGVVYASSTSALATGTALTFDGTNLGLGGTPNSYGSTTTLTVTGSSYSEIDFKAGSTLQGHIAGGGSSLEIGTDGAFPLLFKINGSEQMRLTSTGLGIGTSAGTAKFYVLTADSAPSSSGNMTSGSVFTYNTGGVALNIGSSSGGYVYFNSAYANNAGVAAAYRWYQGATQAMTMDVSGNLALGLTSAARRLEVSGAGAGETYQLRLGAGNSNTSFTYDIGRSTVDGLFRFYGNQTGYTGYIFGGVDGERARIDTSGNLLVGSTTANGKLYVSGAAANGVTARFDGSSNATNPLTQFITSDTTGNPYFTIYYTDSTSNRGSIQYNRGTGLMLYNTTSDYRAKDIYGPVADSGVLIDSVPVYMGKMKGATQERPMFIAHEVPAYAHTGEKDAVDADGNPVYQQMDASALIPVMWAEIQSLRARLKAANI